MVNRKWVLSYRIRCPFMPQHMGAKIETIRVSRISYETIQHENYSKSCLLRWNRKRISATERLHCSRIFTAGRKLQRDSIVSLRGLGLHGDIEFGHSVLFSLDSVNAIDPNNTIVR